MLNMQNMSAYKGDFSFRFFTFLGVEDFITIENKITFLHTPCKQMIVNMKQFFSEL